MPPLDKGHGELALGITDRVSVGIVPDGSAGIGLALFIFNDAGNLDCLRGLPGGGGGWWGCCEQMLDRDAGGGGGEQDEGQRWGLADFGESDGEQEVRNAFGNQEAGGGGGGGQGGGGDGGGEGRGRRGKGKCGKGGGEGGQGEVPRAVGLMLAGEQAAEARQGAGEALVGGIFGEAQGVAYLLEGLAFEEPQGQHRAVGGGEAGQGGIEVGCEVGEGGFGSGNDFRAHGGSLSFVVGAALGEFAGVLGTVPGGFEEPGA